MMERLNNSYYKLTSLFHEDGKGSVSCPLNTTKCKHNDKHKRRNKGTSSHETSHISTSEICEFRVHSTPPRFKMNNIVLQSKIIINGTKNISFSFPLVRVNFSLHSNGIKHTGTNVRFPVSVFVGDTGPITKVL